MTDYPCNPDTTIAYDKNHKPVNIQDALSKRNRQDRQLFCEKGHEMSSVKLTLGNSYFRHTNPADNPMSEWHKNHQDKFDDKYQEIYSENKDARADVCFKKYNFSLEFQASRISREDVMKRTGIWNREGIKIKWILRCPKLDIYRVVDKTIHEQTLILTFNDTLYKSFMDYDNIWIDTNDGHMMNINPKMIKNGMLRVYDTKFTHDEFVQKVMSNDFASAIRFPPQASIHIIQRAAGSSKTYTMIEYALSPESCFSTFCIVSKRHSVRTIIKDELKPQMTKLIADGILKDTNIKFVGKKYVLEITYLNNGVKKLIIISTIDSFMYNIGERKDNTQTTNDFVSICMGLAENWDHKLSNTGNIPNFVSGYSTFLNMKSLIMIDEVQDLQDWYAKACERVVEETRSSLYVVGDKLQAIDYINHSMKYLSNLTSSTTTEIIIPEPVNMNRRVNNISSRDFINRTVPFASYNLPKTELVNSNGSGGVRIFHIENCHPRDTKLFINNVKRVANDIYLQMKKQELLPEDVLVISLFVKNNKFAHQLQSQLHIKITVLFKDKDYQKNVLDKSDYWRTRYNNEEILEQYSFLHYAEECGSIDLNQSSHKVRMVSIQSSKGDGRKSVFLCGLSESNLLKFSGGLHNEMFENLYYVAVSRHKENLTIYLQNNQDNIHGRIYETGLTIETISNSFPIHKITTYDDILRWFQTNYNPVYETMIRNNTTNRIEFPHEDTPQLDMKHHQLRYKKQLIVLCSYILSIYGSGKGEQNQLHGILKTIKLSNITRHYNDFGGYWKDMSQENTIPILSYDNSKSKKLPSL